MELVDFVIDNCNRQNATAPQDYIGMTLACRKGLSIQAQLKYLSIPHQVTIWDILFLGRMVMNDSALNFRTVPVVFANGNLGVTPEHIERLINQLLENQRYLTPFEFYQEFERIHPFVDGNGRVGAILYNVLTGTFWGNPPEIEW